VSLSDRLEDVKSNLVTGFSVRGRCRRWQEGENR